MPAGSSRRPPWEPASFPGSSVPGRARLRNNGGVSRFKHIHREVLTAWAIAILEGFSTLAVEVIAIRLAVPVVGSSTTLTGVMLGIVLFALSAGYWRGGGLSARSDPGRIRKALARNLLAAAVLYGAVAFPFEAALMEKLLDAGLSLPPAIGATAMLLLVPPIYLASQTVPMLAELTNVEGKAGEASGRVLFFSTLGSVAGGVSTPVWLFPSIGVRNTGYLVCAILAGAAAAMAARQVRAAHLAGVGAAAVMAIAAVRAMASPAAGEFFFDSAYQTIRIVEAPVESGRRERALLMGGGRSSGIYADTGETSISYVLAAGKALAETRPERVLVIGAAGFTFPRDAAQLAFVQRVDAVDVDPVVREIAERRFLRRPLAEKIRFLPLSARYAVRSLRKTGRYGFAFLDAYNGRGIPDELVTVEFFRDVRQVAPRTVANVIMERDMESDFARNTLATFKEAFGEAWVQDVAPGDSYLTNVMVSNWPARGSERWEGKGVVYRDEKNSADSDHVRMMW